MTKFIDAHKHEFGVEPICRTLQVAPSSYYAVKSRRPSARSVSDTARTVEVERVHRNNYGVVLDALEMGIWTRQREGRDLSQLVHHSDRGVQYRAIRYTERLAEAGAVASVGSKGDSYDNALAEAVNSIFKAELIRNRGPWRGLEDLEIATVEYIDWFNHRRLHGELGMVPPVEFEHDHYRHNPAPTTVEAALPSLH